MHYSIKIIFFLHKNPVSILRTINYIVSLYLKQKHTAPWIIGTERVQAGLQVHRRCFCDKQKTKSEKNKMPTHTQK